MADIDHALLVKILDYNPDTGEFRNKVNRGKARAGQLTAVTQMSNGYFQVRVERGRFLCHRLAWFYVHGEWPEYIDHINKDRADNRLANLRDVTHSQNMHNVGPLNRNKTGVRGVSWDKARRKWIAHISVRGRQKNLGRFDDIELAKKAYESAVSHFAVLPMEGM